MKNLEVLENLKVSAKEQNEELMSTIEEIHNQRLDSIQTSLMNILREKLNIFNQNTKEELNQKKQIPVGDNWNIKSNNIDYINDILFSVAKSNQRFTSLANSFKFAIYRTKSEIHQSTNKRSDTKSRQNNNIHQNQGLKDDSIGTTTKSGATKEREAKYRAYKKAGKTRDGIYQQITADTEALRTKLGEYNEEEQRAKQSIIAKIANIGRIISELANKIKIKMDSLKIGEVIKDETIDLLETKTNNTKRIKK